MRATLAAESFYYLMPLGRAGFQAFSLISAQASSLAQPMLFCRSDVMAVCGSVFARLRKSLWGQTAFAGNLLVAVDAQPLPA